MRAISSGEVWQVDFGLAAKVRPALLLTSNPAEERQRAEESTMVLNEKPPCKP